MAAPTYTLADLEAAVAHALGRTVSTGNTAGRIVNRALSHLVGSHDWTWRSKLQSLAFVQDQSYIALPTDFMELASLRSTSTARFLPVTLDRIQELRELGTSYSGSVWHWAIQWTTQAAVTAAPVARMELFPTPTAAAAAVGSMLYRRQIRPLADQADLADIPAPLYPLLEQACRAHAHSAEEPGESETEHEWQLYREDLAAAIQRDGRIQPSPGRLRSQLGQTGAAQIFTAGFTP